MNTFAFIPLLAAVLIFSGGVQPAYSADHSAHNHDMHTMDSDAAAHDMKMNHDAHKNHQQLSPEEMQRRMLKWMPIADSVIGTTPDGALAVIDQDGKRRLLSSFYDKPLLVTFVFASCPNICPAVNAKLAKAIGDAQKQYGDNFRALTISFDTTTDDTQIMHTLGSSFTDDFSKWTFAVAEPDSVAALTKAFGFSYMSHPEEVWAHIAMITAVKKGGVIMQQIYGTRFRPGDFDPAFKAILGDGK
jgi:protein SCO1/2